MNQNENGDTTFQIISEGLIQLIKKSTDEINEINEFKADLKNIGRDKAEKIIQLFNKYSGYVDDENKIFEEMSGFFRKLKLNSEAKVEIQKDILEELYKLKSELDSKKME